MSTMNLNLLRIENGRLAADVAALEDENRKLRAALTDFDAGRDPDMMQLAQLVARAYRVSVADLRGASRLKNIVAARQHFMWLAHQPPIFRSALARSLPQIGAWLGGRHHTTVLHGVRRHEKRRLDDATKRLAA